MFINNKTILLVEDNPDDELLTIRALKKNEVAQNIVVARDGIEALDYIFNKGKYQYMHHNSLPSLIILDIQLPKMDGFEVLKQLRLHEKTRYIPVVVLTTSKEEKDISECFELGANSFIRKPVDFLKFNEIITQVGKYWLDINEPVWEKAI